MKLINALGADGRTRRIPPGEHAVRPARETGNDGRKPVLDSQPRPRKPPGQDRPDACGSSTMLGRGGCGTLQNLSALSEKLPGDFVPPDAASS